jgi:hypothetical protein
VLVDRPFSSLIFSSALCFLPNYLDMHILDYLACLPAFYVVLLSKKEPLRGYPAYFTYPHGPKYSSSTPGEKNATLIEVHCEYQSIRSR